MAQVHQVRARASYEEKRKKVRKVRELFKRARKIPGSVFLRMGKILCVNFQECERYTMRMESADSHFVHSYDIVIFGVLCGRR
jgi:hypothetical protein